MPGANVSEATIQDIFSQLREQTKSIAALDKTVGNYCAAKDVDCKNRGHLLETLSQAVAGNGLVVTGLVHRVSRIEEKEEDRAAEHSLPEREFRRNRILLICTFTLLLLNVFGQTINFFRFQKMPEPESRAEEGGERITSVERVPMPSEKHVSIQASR